jgi:Protein of unknown function (DUF992)
VRRVDWYWANHHFAEAGILRFQADQPGRQEDYDGTITKFSLDLGVTGGGVMMWAVFTDTVAGPGFLAGDYVGASGEASVGAGLGANVLIGGSNRTVALQPVSVGGGIGLNLAVGSLLFVWASPDADDCGLRALSGEIGSTMSFQCNHRGDRRQASSLTALATSGAHVLSSEGGPARKRGCLLNLRSTVACVVKPFICIAGGGRRTRYVRSR